MTNLMTIYARTEPFRFLKPTCRRQDFKILTIRNGASLKNIQIQGLEFEATNADLRVLHRCSRNYAIDSHVGIRLTKAGSSKRSFHFAWLAGSNFWNRGWTITHPAIRSVGPSPLRAQIWAWNLSDSSRSVETESLCTAFSPRTSVTCAWKTKRRLSNKFCSKF